MPSVDSNSSCYSSSESSTSSLSSPRIPIIDLVQQQQQPPSPMRIPPTAIPSAPITQSHVCVTRYKTELCRPFTETGNCKYGDKCQFSHGMNELRILMRHPKYKTEYCRTFHTTGYCPYGPRCHFIHNMHEARATSNSDDSSITRRHSDLRTNSSPAKSSTRNRVHREYRTYSDQSHHLSKYPFSLEELSIALLSYDSNEVFQAPSMLPTAPDTFTRRTFSSSSSTSSSTPRYS